MANSPIITLSAGTLREGNTIDLIIDWRGDLLSFKHTTKKWSVFAEKNIKFNAFTEEFYYDEGEGVLYDAVDADNIVVRNLVPGRLFAIFEYTSFFGVFERIIQVFQVLPKTTITIDSDITAGGDGTFSSTTTLSNVGVAWSFADDSSSITGSEVTKTILPDGYFTTTATFDYSQAKHSNGSNVVWKTAPDDLIPTIAYGYLAGGTPVIDTVTEQISGTYLSKYDVESKMDLNVTFSKSVENTYEAPLFSIFTDNSTYQIGISGDNRIEYTYLNFGDGEIIKGLEVGFTYNKIFKRSGEYFGTYIVNTVHTTSGGPEYRQSVQFDFSVEVTPFFDKWLRKHLTGKIFNSNGFNDLALAWGTQMDRVYNEVQTLVDSIDVEKIDNKFVRSFAATYGDFPEIYEKLGFWAFVENLEDRFNFLMEYNFFDRLESGNLTDTEKQEFLNYIQTTRKRLSLKGTPISMERAIAQFGLIATVNELWTNSFEVKTFKPIKDEVFGGEQLVNNTGLRHKAVSTPTSDNINQPIINNKMNSYIEIDTKNRSSIGYYTSSSSVTTINGKKYVVFMKT